MIDSLPQLGAAIRLRRLAKRLTLDDLARATGISKPYLSNIETARAPGPPSEEKLDRLAAALGLEPASLQAAADWLRTPDSVRALLGQLEAGAAVARRPDGTVDLDAAVHQKRSTAPAPAEHIAGAFALRGIPIINKVAAGRAGEFGDLDYPVNIADDYLPSPDLPPVAGGPSAMLPGTFAVRVSGDSMIPDYQDGDLVVVTPEDPKDGDDCLVRLGARENFATTLKRIYFEKDGETIVRLRLVPLNPAHATWKVNAEEVTGLYPVLYKVTPMRRRN
jgi:repressor LexA